MKAITFQLFECSRFLPLIRPATGMLRVAVGAFPKVMHPAARYNKTGFMCVAIF
jgi:hypothetical protein